MRIVVELTKCYPGTHSESLRRVTELATQRGVRSDGIYIIARPDQSTGQQEFPELIHWEEVQPDRLQVNMTVRRVLNDLCTAAVNDPVLLVSYDAAVLKVGNERHWNGMSVTSMPLSAVRDFDSGPGPVAIRQTRSWPFEALIDLQSAMMALRALLEERGSNSLETHIKATDLRPALALKDQRFEGNATATGTSGLISALIRCAEAQGLIEVNRSLMPKTPLVWLRPQQPQSMNSQVISTCDSGPSTSHAQGSETKTELVEHRSRKLEEFLRNSGMGPYKDARIAMYDAVEAIHGEAGPLPLDTLMIRAMNNAKEQLRQIGLDTETKKQPWTKVVAFLKRILTTSGVLHGTDGQAIEPGWTANLEVVSKLDDGWRTKADAEIVLALITATDDVSDDDVSDLAGLLYHSRTDENRERVFHAVAHLLRTGKAVQVPKDGRQYLRPADGKGPASLKFA